ncbi:unnamed protein product [Phytophthora fragariaefolia]|uniref:Unnamed protein product n=1 Tax=Phytophthora fragariaefolia TaxID=1490495 RepID=A0A9W6WY91_9STRA|nr:unnamed protein product [Phytophthora fragariaefolia]
MDLWVGDLVGQHAILGMNFMVPAGVRIDTADGTACLPDEVRIQLIGRRPLYGANMYPICVASLLRIGPGQTRDVLLRPDMAALLLWVTRGNSWVVTLVKGKIGRESYLRVTNVGERRVTLDAHTPIRWWTPADAAPLAFGFVQPDSRRYQEWRNIAYGATCDADDAWTTEEPDVPLTDHPTYQTPQKGLGRRFSSHLGLYHPARIFRMAAQPFGLCNAPQIYQRLIDNALYGFLRLSPDDAARGVFKKGEPVRPEIHSVLERRSYIDDILIGGTSWDDWTTYARKSNVC